MPKFDFGLEIVCVDFHLHTRRDREFVYTGEDNDFVNDYVEALMQKQIAIGVITNHNKFDLAEYKALRKKAKQNDICLLPGVELSVKEGSNGLHTLIVFNPDQWINNGDDWISNFITVAFQGIPNHQNANTRCLFDVRQVLERLDSYSKDYFIVFAHIEQANGLLYECNGGLIQSLAQTGSFREKVLGVQKLRTHDNIPKLAQWLGYNIALVEGSDPKKINEIGKERCQTYIKLGAYSFDALKYALVDHENRIFNNNENLHRSYIESINFTGGKLDGVVLNLSPQLNTLIGIRGSGKSSVLEVLRWVFGIDATADKPYKSKLVEFILGSGGKAVVRIVDQHGCRYDISRINGDRLYITDCVTGNCITASVGSLIKNVLYFGQKDLARSDAEENYEKKLLDKLLGDRVPAADLERTETELTEAVKNLLNVNQIPDKIKDLEGKIADLDHKLKIFVEKGITEKLKKQTEYSADKTKLEGMVSGVESILSKLIGFSRTVTLQEVSLDSYTSVYNTGLFSRAQTVVGRIADILQKVTGLCTELDTEKITLVAIQTELMQFIEGLKEEFAHVQREINDDTLDLKGYLKYTEDKDKYTLEIERLRREATSMEDIKARIMGLSRHRNDSLMEVFRAYETEINRLNSMQKALIIKIVFKGNVGALSQLVASSFRGTMIRSAEAKTEQICTTLQDGVALLMDILIDNGMELKKVLVAETEYVKFKEKVLSDCASYIRCCSEDRIDILYHGKPLREHSLGQRASALVLSILTQDDSDIIIIDQPEDDLDNQVVYQEFIKMIKDKKPNVQFIFATHNPNIPVLGDAERVIAMHFTEQAIVPSMGNIDNTESHTKIVEIMEGGPEAFRRRNEIYHAWNQQ